jgi:hypothetical protein
MRVMTPPQSEHRLTQHGFARRGVADDGEVPDICRRVGFHNFRLRIVVGPKIAGAAVLSGGRINRLKRPVP